MLVRILANMQTDISNYDEDFCAMVMIGYL